MKKLLLSLLLLLGCLLPLRAEEVLVADPMDVMNVGSTYKINWKGNNSYTTTIKSNDGYWGYENFNNNNNSWTDIRCGRKNDKSGNQFPSIGQIYNCEPIPEVVTRVDLNVTTLTTKYLSYINSIYLEVGDSEDNLDSTKQVSIPVPSTTGIISFNIPADVQTHNGYYRIFIDCKGGASENGYFGFDWVKFYTDTDLQEGGKAVWRPPFENHYTVLQGRSIDLGAIVNEENVPTLSYSMSGDSTAGTLDSETGLFTAGKTADDVTVTINYTWEETEVYQQGRGSFLITVIHEIEYFIDELDVDDFNLEVKNEYQTSNFTSKDTDISYQVLSLVSADHSFQLNKNKAGIVVTANPNNYYLARVDVKWDSETTNGSSYLEVYGKNTAYTTVSDFLSANDELTHGVMIANMTDPNNTDEIWTAIANPYSFIGLKGNDGVEYIKYITLYWVKREAAIGPAPIEVPNVVISGNTADAEETNLLTAGTTIAIAVPENAYTSYRVHFDGDTENWLQMPEGSILIRPGVYDGFKVSPLETDAADAATTITFKSGELYTPTVVAYRTADNILEEKETVCDPFLTQPAMSVTPSMAENTALVPRSVQFYVTNPAAKIYYSTTKSMDNAEVYTGPVELAVGADILFWCELEADTDTRATTTYTSPAVFFQNNEAAPVSVEGIAADENAEVRYFDLQGRAVKADRLNPGIYIRIRGSKASKILVR